MTTQPMTSADELRALAERATPGTCKGLFALDVSMENARAIADYCDTLVGDDLGNVALFMEKEEAELYIAMRNALPAPPATDEGK